MGLPRPSSPITWSRPPLRTSSDLTRREGGFRACRRHPAQRENRHKSRPVVSRGRRDRGRHDPRHGDQRRGSPSPWAGDAGDRRQGSDGHPRPERLPPAPDPRRAQLQHGAALGRRAQPGRRPADAQGAGPAHPAAAVGARRRRLDRVPVRRAAHAHPRRDQRRLGRHAGLRPASLRPGHPEQGGAAGRRLHEGHARPARRRNPTRQARQPDRPADRPAECRHPVRDAGEGAEAPARAPDELHPPFYAGIEPAGPHQRH